MRPRGVCAVSALATRSALNPSAQRCGTESWYPASGQQRPRGPIPGRERVAEPSAPSEITPIRDRRCAGSSRMLWSAVSSAGSRGVMLSWMSTGGGASTGTAARGGGLNGKRVPRTGWRFVRHLNRLSALAFLQPVRKVSLGAEFPTPFRESILRPGLPTPLPRAGRAEHTERVEPRLGSRFVALGKSEIFVLRPEDRV